MQHKICGRPKAYRCSVCLQKWMGKPRSECPGLPVYKEGKYPDHLALKDALFGKGLKLADNQQPAAYFARGYSHQEPLYALSDCVPSGCTVKFDNGKYAFEETPDGCNIWRFNGLCLPIAYIDTYLIVGTSHFNLYQYRDALNAAANWFTSNLLSRFDEDDHEFRDAATMIEKALSKRFYEQWQRIKTLASSDVEEVSRLIYASTQRDAAIMHNPDLYTDKYQYALNDLKKYHACRMFAATLGHDDLDKLLNWREYLTPTVPNKALNKTLDKIPVAISYKQITRLSTIKLDQPVTNRLHLIFILCSSDHHNWGLHERTVITATPEMIKTVGELRGRALKTQSKTRVIGELASYILDYPNEYHGDLLGLARRSIEWHDHFDRVDDSSHIPPSDTPLVIPDNVDLDALQAKGITLLRTAGDCYKEREKMRHCIHTYASKAAKGLCYLFHVDHKIKDTLHMATIEVSPYGVCLQAHGPENRKNEACFYGVEELNKAFAHIKELTVLHA